MTDAQKIALACSFLLRYPSEEWYSELSEWREDVKSIEHVQLRDSLLEFFSYIDEMDKKEFEDQYVRTFDFSQNTTMYLSTYELQGNGEQAEELVTFKAFFLENGYDVPTEMPDYVPALLELCAVIDEDKATEIYEYCKTKLEYIRDRLIEAKVVYAFLFDIILAVANGLEGTR